MRDNWVKKQIKEQLASNEEINSRNGLIKHGITSDLSNISSVLKLRFIRDI